VDNTENVYVAGRSRATWGSPVNPHAGDTDAFAAKLNSSGALQWNTFLWSTNSVYGYAIAVDDSGNVYVAGRSDATWGSPVNPHAGGWDVFVAKLVSLKAMPWMPLLLLSEMDNVPGCGPVATQFNKQCYIFVAEELPFDSAQQACMDRFGGNLASINSQEEDDFISTIVDPNDQGNITAYIGFTDVDVEGNWVWTDGSPVDYTNWRTLTGEPNGTGDCTQFWPNNNGGYAGWNDVECDTVHQGYVCKFTP
jgi:hypothetical protein